MYHKLFCLFIVFGLSFQAKGQYTELINTNRPGKSQGAFSVGRDVAQIEAGLNYGQDSHHLLDNRTKSYGIGYEVRYGLIWEELELNLSGDFLFADQNYVAGGENRSTSFNDFKTNVIGAKYLIYDPYKQRAIDGPNLYSWKDNHGFHWRDLIPAVSVYAGANLTFGNRPTPYPFFGEERSNISPKVSVITQHNWGRFVFVMNFTGDRLTDDHRRYSGIFTLTHAFSQTISAFAEFQTINDNFYSDDILRFGGAYLITQDLQVDISGLVNFKDTPSRWQAGLGVSYRLDWHSKNDILDDK